MGEKRYIPQDGSLQRDVLHEGTYEPLPPGYYSGESNAKDSAMHDRIMSSLGYAANRADNSISAMAGGPKHVPASTGKAAAAPAAGKPATAGSKPAPAEVLQATLAPRIARLFKGITYKT